MSIFLFYVWVVLDMENVGLVYFDLIIAILIHEIIKKTKNMTQNDDLVGG